MKTAAMRIAFIDSEPPSTTGGGIRTYLLSLVTLCRSRGMQVRIYSHNPAAYEDAGQEARPIGRRPCWPRGLRGLAYRLFHAEAVAFECANWLAGELRADPPDLAEFADFQGYAFYALRDRALRRRIILRIHTPLYLVYVEARKRHPPFWLLRWRERDCLRRATYITAPSADFIREKMPWSYPQRIVPNPPPLPMPRPNTKENAQTAIVFLGRLEPRKGVVELLQAFLSLAADFPAATLTLIGEAVDPAYRTSLQTVLDAAPKPVQARVAFRPAHTGDKNSLLREFTMLAVPSRWENCPYVFWEGMAAGLACLGTDTGEMRRARGITQAPVVKPGDAESLAQGLRALLQDPSQRAALIARQEAYLHQVAGEARGLPEFYAACVPP